VNKAAAFNGKSWTQWVGLVLRVVLGGLFIYAAYTKFIDLDAAKRSVMAYRLFPSDIAKIIGLSVPIIEVALGLLLVFGLFTRVAALALTFLLVIYIGGIISVWARHIMIDCGCFSQGGFIKSWPNAVKGYKRDILRDFLMVLGALWLVFLPRTALSVDRWLKGSSDPYDSFDEVDDGDEADASDTESEAGDTESEAGDTEPEAGDTEPDA
jgi:uncharacterized membrane protein YphA (DoxX/SURF4 family)